MLGQAEGQLLRAATGAPRTAALLRLDLDPEPQALLAEGAAAAHQPHTAKEKAPALNARSTS